MTITHEAVRAGEGVTRCCGKTPFELPMRDRFTVQGDADCPGRRLVCPECRDGKHAICIHEAMRDDDDEIVDCACGCEPSRTCPSCKDVVPVGWTLEVHFNCDWPEDFEPIKRSGETDAVTG